MIEQILLKIGLGEKEIKLFKLLLEYGKLTASALCRFSGIQRTTVYSVLKELKLKGLVIEEIGGKITYFVPTPLGELSHIVKRDQERLEDKNRALLELAEFIKQNPGSKFHPAPKIRYIEEANIEEYLHEATMKWHESMLKTDATWWGFQDASLVGKFEKWIDWSWQVAPEKINLKLLTNYDEIEEKMKNKKYANRRKLKKLEKTEFTATEWIIGDYVVYLQTSLKPYSLVEIHDATLAHNTRELFKLFWK